MEAKVQELDGKLRTLKFTPGKSNEVIETRNVEAINRHETSKGKSRRHSLRDEIIELKFGNNETKLQVQEWVEDIESTLKASDKKLIEIRLEKEKITKGNQAAKLSETLKQEIAFEHEKHQLKMSQERELYEQQLQFQKALTAGEQNQTKKVLSTKLPKLSITQFDGKCANWLPFWNKFVAEIDSAELSAVTKFAYLKEFVKPNYATFNK